MIINNKNDIQHRYQSLKKITDKYGDLWYNHYKFYLMEMCFQLFEWTGLPETVDPRFLERMLHEVGYVVFYKDENIGYLALQGATSGELNYYNLPTTFTPSMVNYQHKTIQLLNYDEMDDKENKGILIMNNDLMRDSIQSLQLFAVELTEIKEVIRMNMNAQKTPVLISANDKTLLSMKNIYNQYEGNSPVIIVDESLDHNAIKVFKTEAPYVIDKLNTQKNAVWNELMTFLGVDNANLEKRERMITSEADSNNEQIAASSNRMLKARKEAVKKINEYYGLNIDVRLRTEIIEKMRGELFDGELYNAAQSNNREYDTIREKYDEKRTHD